MITVLVAILSDAAAAARWVAILGVRVPLRTAIATVVLPVRVSARLAVFLGTNPGVLGVAALLTRTTADVGLALLHHHDLGAMRFHWLLAGSEFVTLVALVCWLAFASGGRRGGDHHPPPGCE